jgi:hypothetical protein
MKHLDKRVFFLEKSFDSYESDYSHLSGADPAIACFTRQEFDAHMRCGWVGFCQMKKESLTESIS